VFHRLQRRYPTRVEPYVKAADTYLAESVPMLDGAHEELDKGLAACGQRAELLERKGRILAASGRVADARRVFEDYLRLWPDEPVVRVALADVLLAEFQTRMRREDARNLAALVARAREAHPAHPRLDFAEGVVKRAEGRFAESVALLERSLAREPEDADVARIHGETLKALGFSLLLAGRKDEALVTFRKVVDLGLPDFDLGTIPSILDTQAKWHFQQGISLFESGDAAGAAEAFRTVRRFFPEHPDVLFNLGLTLIDLKEYEEAASLLELAEARLVAEAKDFGLVRSYRVLALRALGKSPEAARLAEEFIAAHPASDATPRLRSALHEMGKN
jgi:tetratricopeptide (TPR) repeat protein